jgi:hypothetical protein
MWERECGIRGSNDTLTLMRVQAAFTAKELREQMKLPGVHFHTDIPLLQSELTAGADYLSKTRPLKRLMGILEKEIALPANKTGDKSWTLDFLRSPTKILPDASETTVQAIEYEINRLEGPVNACKAIGTGEFTRQECGLVLRSIGYKSTALEGVPFDNALGRVPNQYGKVVDNGNEVSFVTQFLHTIHTSFVHMGILNMCFFVPGTRLVHRWMVEERPYWSDCHYYDRCVRNCRYYCR